MIKNGKVRILMAGICIGMSLGIMACGSEKNKDENTQTEAINKIVQQTTKESETQIKKGTKEELKTSEVSQEQSEEENEKGVDDTVSEFSGQSDVNVKEDSTNYEEPEESQTKELNDEPSEATSEEVIQNVLAGRYTGSADKYIEVMGSYIHYDIEITFNDGNYKYTVNITVSGNQQYSADEVYEGTYELNQDKIIMTGKLESGTLSNGAVILNGYLSGFSGSLDSVTVYQ